MFERSIFLAACAPYHHAQRIPPTRGLLAASLLCFRGMFCTDVVAFVAMPCLLISASASLRRLIPSKLAFREFPFLSHRDGREEDSKGVVSGRLFFFVDRCCLGHIAPL